MFHPHLGERRVANQDRRSWQRSPNPLPRRQMLCRIGDWRPDAHDPLSVMFLCSLGVA